jgi:hypothetical protein
MAKETSVYIAIRGEDPSIMGKALKYNIIDKFFITNKQIGQKKLRKSIRFIYFFFFIKRK